MFRFALGIILIGIGVFAPWLVRDWLDWSADQRAADRLHDVVTSFYRGGKKDQLASHDSAVIQEGERRESTGFGTSSNSVRSGRDALKTVRFFQGFLPDGFSGKTSRKLPFMGMSASPTSTSHSRAVVSKTSSNLKGSLSRIGLRLGDPVFIRIFKEENELEVWMRPKGKPDYSLFKVYRMKSWAGVPGPKLREGDGQALEGFYYVSAARMIPDSKHFLAMDLGFPNAYDEYHGRTGSDMLIHGGKKHAGSFALGPDAMSEVYTLAQGAMQGGQRFFRVNVFPFRMTDRRMASEWARQPRWISFWQSLKEGYDFFENVNYPPDVTVQAGEYAFSLH